MSSSRICILVAALALPLSCSPRGGDNYIPSDKDGGGDSSTGDDASATDVPVDPDAPTSCPSLRTLCSGSCVDTLADNANCGVCGRRCAVGTNCNDGSCRAGTPTCAAPRMMCSATCVDTGTDVANCGSCGRRCTSTQACVSGACTDPTPSCAAPRMMCSAGCVDVQSDIANCGTCARRCLTGQSCVAGVCTTAPPACAAPRMMCSGSCIDVQSDPANCGFCGVRCATGQSCSGAFCVGGVTCMAPRAMCPSGCTDVQSDPINCGGCGTRCATGQTCSLGRCQAGTGSTSRAGAACTMPDPMGGMDPACADLLCVQGGSTPFCTVDCTNNSSQATERAMCGGTGSTCLTQGDGTEASSLCTAACSPTAGTGSTGACRSGFVCTGWWYTHTGATPDSPGCFGFCSSNAQCPSGRLCNARVGSCGTTGVVTTRLADGLPCNPSITSTVPGETTPRNIQCRGLCFSLSDTDRTQGICGSFLNTRETPTCPDVPAMEPLARAGADNLAICLFRPCTRNSGCSAPLICRYQEDTAGTPVTTGPTLCQYPSAAQRTGIP